MITYATPCACVSTGDSAATVAAAVAASAPAASSMLTPSNSVSALIAVPPSTDAFRRAHRHSIPGHRLNNYLKFLNELAAKGSSTAHLFSTAVISGSSSAPNLKEEDMPQHGDGIGKIKNKYYS